MADVRAHVLISGMVQGVFFRAYTQERARSLGITGWVRNCPGGRVEAVFEGEKVMVDKMIEWCNKGPSAAIIDKVDVQFEEYTGEFGTFNVKYW